MHLFNDNFIRNCKKKPRNNLFVLQLENEVTMVHPYNETLPSNKKEENIDTHNNMNE